MQAVRLKRNVVVRKLCFLRFCRCSPLRWRARLFASTTYELHICGMNLKGISLLTIAISPFFNAQPALYVNGTPFGQVLRGRLRLSSPEGHAKPSGGVLHLTSAIFSPLVRGDGEATDGGTLRRIAQLRVASQIAYDGNLIERHRIFMGLSR
jgi:hypothetical protein